MKRSNQTLGTNCYKNLSDKILEATLLQSVSKENQLKIEILHLLAEVERRRLYSKNYPSLFEYCTKVLKYSASSAQRRIDTMRAMRLIPEIEQKIMTGELNLSSVAKAQSFFRHEAKIGKSYSIDSKKEVLKKLENKTTKECVKELIEFMVKLTLDRIDPAEKAKRIQKRIECAKNNDRAPSQNKVESSEDNAHLLPIIGSETCVKEKGIFETSPEGPKHRGVSPRYISSTVKCEVYMRDKGQCTHPNCGSRKFLEYDHILPIAMGGKSTVGNLRLLCRNHNQYAAIKKLGLKKMGRYLRS